MKNTIAGLVVVGVLACCKASDEDFRCFGIDESSIVQLGAPGLAPNSDQPHSNDGQDSPWDHLAFGSSGNVLTSIEFETYSEPEHSKRRLVSFNDAVKATKTVSTDKELLAMFQYSFSGNHCLRNIVRPGSIGGVGGTYLFGRLTLVTKTKSVSIGVGTSGFSIDGNVPGTNTEFYSPAGAELLSMLYCRQTRVPLRASHVSALNGQHFIDMQMRALHQLQWSAFGSGPEGRGDH